MTQRSDPPIPAENIAAQTALARQSWHPRLPTGLLRLLASLLVSLTGFLSWHLSEQGHVRLSLASQTVPALPELRPAPTPPVSFAGLGGSAESVVAAPVLSFGRAARLSLPELEARPPELLALGRMNLDGG